MPRQQLPTSPNCGTPLRLAVALLQVPQQALRHRLTRPRVPHSGCLSTPNLWALKLRTPKLSNPGLCKLPKVVERAVPRPTHVTALVAGVIGVLAIVVI